MRTTYSVSFQLGHSSTDSVEPSEVAKACLDWVFQQEGVREPTGLRSDPLVSLPKTDLGSGATIELISIADDDKSMKWGLRFAHPDRSTDDLSWQTELCIEQKVSDSPTWLGCTNKLGSALEFRPARRSATRPRIVLDLLDKFGGTAGLLPLSTGALTIPLGEVELLIEFLKSPQRARPVVFISVPNASDQPLIDPQPVARNLCGLAHVVVAESRLISSALSGAIPSRLACWDGAIRVYWPGFRPSDNPFHHNLLVPRAIAESGGKRVSSDLLERITEVAIHSQLADRLTWLGLETARRQRLMEDLRSRGDMDELLEMADEEISGLKARIAELKSNRRELGDELRQSKDEANSWREAYQQERQGGAAAAGQPLTLPIRSVSEAVERASREFDTLVFALNSESGVNDNPFKAPDELFAALEWLATVYVDARAGAVPCANFDLSLREACGWKYDANQSKITMSRFKSWYTTQWNGTTYQLGAHVKIGSGKDSRHTIRVAFEWDADAKKVVIGFIGQHQRTEAT